MKKIKITEKQSKLLGLRKVAETDGEETGMRSAGSVLGPKPVRVVISGPSVPMNQELIINTIIKQDKDARLNFFEVTGKIVGTVSDTKIMAIKRDLKSIDQTITFEKKAITRSLKENTKNLVKITKEQYNRIFASGLNESINKVDNAFKKEFSTKDVQNLKSVSENNFDITQPNTDIPASAQGKFGKPVMEGGDDIKNETVELIKYLYRKSEDFSPFWEKHSLTYDDICDTLLGKKLIVKNNGKYEVSKALGTPEKAMQAIEGELRGLVGSDTTQAGIETEASNYPAGAENDSNAPWNEKPLSTPMKPKQNVLTVVSYNREIALLADASGGLYVFYYGEIPKQEFADFASTEKTFVGKDEDGQPEYELGDFEVDGEVLERYINTNLKGLTKGEGQEAFENGVDLVKVDTALKQELLSLYDKDKKMVVALSRVTETTSAASSGAFTGPMNAQPIKKVFPIDNKLDVPVVGETIGTNTLEESGWKDIVTGGLITLGSLGGLKAQDNPNKITPKPTPTTIQAVGHYRNEEPNKITYSDDEAEVEVRPNMIVVYTINTMLAQLLHNNPNTLHHKKFGDGEYVFVLKKDEASAKFIDDKIKMYQNYVSKVNGPKKTYETTSGNGSMGQYDANALPNIARDGSFKTPKKTTAQTKTQYAGGGFVTMNDCTKLNNKPAGSGCSQGAVDNVVKVTKTKANVNAPSLGKK